MVDDDPEFFDAEVVINKIGINDGNFEWRAGTLSHKITEAIQDQKVKSVQMTNIDHSFIVTSEAISVISKLPKPVTGFEFIRFEFLTLEAKLSETVVDQFLQHTRYLKKLIITGYGLENKEKLNAIDFATTILDNQEEPILTSLDLSSLSTTIRVRSKK